jgi:hypothetical protein
MDVVVMGDGRKQEVGAAVINLFVLPLAFLVLEDDGANPSFFQGILLFLVVQVGEILVGVQAYVLSIRHVKQA